MWKTVASSERSLSESQLQVDLPGRPADTRSLRSHYFFFFLFLPSSAAAGAVFADFASIGFSLASAFTSSSAASPPIAVCAKSDSMFGLTTRRFESVPKDWNVLAGSFKTTSSCKNANGKP